MSLVVSLWRSCLDLWSSPRCAACGEGVSASCPLCPPCAAGLVASRDAPEWVTAPFDHGGPLMRAVHRAKYGDDPSVARSLGALLVPHALAWRGEVDVVVPVPLHPARLRTRGYNQSYELARPVARALGASLRANVIARVRETGTQTARSREDRHENVRGAFAARGASLAGTRVLLVDDVVTTGATLSALRDAALGAGAVAVRGLTLTRMARWLG